MTKAAKKKKRKVRTRLERLGLMKVDVPANVYDVIKRRIAAVRKLNLDDASLDILPQRVDRFGADCYLQGLIDGAGAGARNPEIVDG